MTAIVRADFMRDLRARFKSRCEEGVDAEDIMRGVRGILEGNLHVQPTSKVLSDHQVRALYYIEYCLAKHAESGTSHPYADLRDAVKETGISLGIAEEGFQEPTAEQEAQILSRLKCKDGSGDLAPKFNDATKHIKGHYRHSGLNAARTAEQKGWGDVNASRRIAAVHRDHQGR